MLERNENWAAHPVVKKYLVSDMGRVKNVKTGRVLKGNDSKGYKVVGGEKFGVHRLVAETFIGLTSALEVNHKNFNRSDNRLENLEWCTHAENIRHAFRNGRVNTARGENHGSNKYSAAMIEDVREKLKTGLGHSEISRLTKVSRDIVYLVSRNKIWNQKKKIAGTISS